MERVISGTNHSVIFDMSDSISLGGITAKMYVSRLNSTTAEFTVDCVVDTYNKLITGEILPAMTQGRDGQYQLQLHITGAKVYKSALLPFIIEGAIQ